MRKLKLPSEVKAIEKTLNDPDFIIEIATKLKQEKKEKLAQKKRADNLQAAIKADRNYTNLGKVIANIEGCITIGQFAKILNNNYINIGRNKLYRFLREEGYLIKAGKDKNMPKQKYIRQGLFKVGEKIVDTLEGEVLSTTTLITGKGQIYLFTLIDDMYYEEIL